ncbi:MAG: hypothetical protein P9M08_09575, partial [Candidatus Erginobacter occultus]|nr:hypothetical protein [Candidatus Erginobacter occultus]
MKYSLVEHPWLKKLSERLPGQSRSARAVRVMGKALLSGKSVVREKRVFFEGVEDAILESHLTVGPGPGEVLVETIYSAVSPGTERAYFLDLPNFHQERPYGPGYSGCGRIRALGRNVTGLGKGALVAGLLKHSSQNVVAAESLQILPLGVEPRDAAFTTLGGIALCGIRAAGDLEGRRMAVVGQGIL